MGNSHDSLTDVGVNYFSVFVPIVCVGVCVEGGIFTHCHLE